MKGQVMAVVVAASGSPGYEYIPLTFPQVGPVSPLFLPQRNAHHIILSTAPYFFLGQGSEFINAGPVSMATSHMQPLKSTIVW